MKVLFVCLGNICRSPMAEYIFRHKVEQTGLKHIEIDSAGTAGYHDGEDMHYGTANMLRQHGISPQGFVSRKVRQSDIDEFDYILVMDDSNLTDMQCLFGKHHKLFKVTDLVPTLGIDHIPDPWYTGNFQQTYELLEQCCDVLLSQICRK